MSARTIHIIPVGKPEPLHEAGPDCWCYPVLREVRIMVHNAKDGRERYERQGITQEGKKWALVYEPKPQEAE